ncbi:unnamed protein product [Gordionus sp. m RMFG-2023]
MNIIFGINNVRIFVMPIIIYAAIWTWYGTMGRAIDTRNSGASASQEKVSNSKAGVEDVELAIFLLSMSAAYPLARDGDAVVPEIGENVVENEGAFGINTVPIDGNVEPYESEMESIESDTESIGSDVGSIQYDIDNIPGDIGVIPIDDAVVPVDVAVVQAEEALHVETEQGIYDAGVMEVGEVAAPIAEVVVPGKNNCFIKNYTFFMYIS